MMTFSIVALWKMNNLAGVAGGRLNFVSSPISYKDFAFDLEVWTDYLRITLKNGTAN
jgi:hypothetical protein